MLGNDLGGPREDELDDMRVVRAVQRPGYDLDGLLRVARGDVVDGVALAAAPRADWMVLTQSTQQNLRVLAPGPPPR